MKQERKRTEGSKRHQDRSQQITPPRERGWGMQGSWWIVKRDTCRLASGQQAHFEEQTAGVLEIQL